jgi:hypothetical protein
MQSGRSVKDSQSAQKLNQRSWTPLNGPERTRVTKRRCCPFQDWSMNNPTLRLRMCAFPALLILLLVGTASDAGAWATIAVNSLADPGKPGICALRDAITAANIMTATNGCSAGKGHDTIRFSVTGTIKLTDTLPEVNDSNLTINGPASPGITLDGDGKVQVMQVGSGATLSLNNLTITHGSAESGAAGGIVNQGSLAVTNGTFSDNSAGPLGSTGLVGGIFNSGTLTIAQSALSGNNGGGGAGRLNGAILNQGTLTVANSTFSGNVMGFDGAGTGGIDNSGALTVTNSVFSSNTGGGVGAISNRGTATIYGSTFSRNVGSVNLGEGAGAIGNETTLTVTNCTFSGNRAVFQGGGIQNSGELTVTNSTFSGNTGGKFGGGIVNAGPFGANAGTVTVINSTFFDNIADYGGGGIANGGPFGAPMRISNTAGTLIVTNSTFSGNSGGDILNINSTAFLHATILGGKFNGGNCSGATDHNFSAITDLSYNISDDDSCGFTATGSLNNTDPMLDPAGLANNGGPTQTIALDSGSPAIDAIPLDSCADQDGKALTTDQRGFPRPDAGEGVCDIGAYEFQDFAGDPGTASCIGRSISALQRQYRSLRAAAMRFGSVGALKKAIRAFCKG